MRHQLLVFLFLIPILANCQNEWNTWYFGAGAGLDFSTNPPIVLNGGQVNSKEGCASISDKTTGEFLFYSDGKTVWNRNHQVMQNGANLSGHYSSAQSAVIVPRPGWPDRYYLFTADAISAAVGYYYNEIDMTLDSGLGGIIPGKKNIFLYGQCTEKIVAIKHCNGIDYWIVTHKGNSSAFYIYQVTDEGISPPIIQTIGSNVTVTSGNWQGAGNLNASQDSKSLVHLIGPSSPGLNAKAELFDFDNSNGSLTYRYAIDQLNGAGRAVFAPSGDYLYIATGQGTNKGLFQFDLQLSNEAAINNSMFKVFDSSPNYFGDIQITPNGDMYVAELGPTANSYPFLSIIHNPNSHQAACNFEHDAINLAPNQSIAGLPNFIANVNYNPPIAQVIDTLCPGQSLTVNSTLYNESKPNGVEYLSNAAVSGCDSIVVVNLYFDNPTSNYAQTLCSGQSITINGATFNESNPNGSITLPNAAQGGCDSIVNVQLLFLPAIQENYTQTLCSGQTIDINGITFSESNPIGSVTLSNAAQGGCDSIVNVQLLFLPAIHENYSQTLCSGQSIDINGTTFSESNPNGSVTLSNAAQNGCDSIINVNILFAQTIIGNFQANSCIGDSLWVNGSSFQYDHSTGSVLIVGGAFGGCDSLVNIDLRFYDDTSQIYQTVCVADTLVVADSIFDFYNPAGIISISGGAYTGCDSIIDVNLDFYSVDTTFVQDTICWYDSIWVNNQAYSFEKMEGFEVIPTDECDSLIAIQLYSPYDQIPVIDILAKDSICYGETVTLNSFSTLHHPIYTWFQNEMVICDSCENASTPIIRDDYFVLHGVDPIGCELVIEKEFDVLMNYGVYVPNVFSPNGDGINDRFTLYANKKGEELVLFQIYDRWGNLVYKAAHKDVHAFKNDGWDGYYKGKLMDTGVYVYVALVKFIDGDVKDFRGDVTLIR